MLRTMEDVLCEEISLEKEKKGLKYQESCYVVSMQIFFNMMKYINPGLISIQIGYVNDKVRYLMEELPPEVSVKCDYLCVTAHPVAFLTSLIARVALGCKLRIDDSRPSVDPEAAIAADVFDFETMRMAPSIGTNVLCEVSDEQFICLRAHTIYMAAPRLSAKGINGMILQWLDDRREIAHFHLTALKDLDRKVVFKNVDGANIISESEIQKSPSLKEYAETWFYDAGSAGVVGIRNKFSVMLLSMSLEDCNLLVYSNKDWRDEQERIAAPLP